MDRLMALGVFLYAYWRVQNELDQLEGMLMPVLGSAMSRGGSEM